MTLTEISIKRPSLIIVIFTILIGGGLICYNQLSYELLPDFSPPLLTVTTVYPGASPSTVENQVSKPMEDALSGLENITEVTSFSLENASLIVLEFNPSADIDKALEEAQRKANTVVNLLPEKAEKPVIGKIEPNAAPVMQVSARAENLDDLTFMKLMEDQIIPQLKQVSGVGEIQIIGGEKRAFQINVDENKINKYGLSIGQVNQMVGASNVEFPSGKVKNPNEQMNVKFSGKYKDIEELKNTVLFSQNGSDIKLKDVADIVDSKMDTKAISRFNGVNGIGLRIKKSSDANAVDVSKAMQEKFKALELKYKDQGLQFAVAIDTAAPTIDAVDAVLHDLEIAILLVAAVMLLFLHSLRNAIIVLISIPASLISTFIAMYLLGYTLNLMTLLAMSLVIGILVDDSIVVLENIYRHLSMGKDKRKASLEGRNEIGFTALAITLVDVVVFSPVVFIEGTISDILHQFSIVVVVSTLMSLFVCFTLTPWLASRFAKEVHLNKSNLLHIPLIWFEKRVLIFTEQYVRLVGWSLRNKILMGSIILGIFIASMATMALGIVGQEFVSQGDQGKFMIKLKFDKSTTFEENNRVSFEIEKMILEDQENIDVVFSNVGGPGSGMGATTFGAEYKTEITVQMRDGKQNEIPTITYMNQVREKIESKYPGVEVKAMNMGLVASEEAPIEIFLSSEDPELLMNEAKRLKNAILDMEGAKDPVISTEEFTPEIKIELDREKMGDYGIPVATVGMQLQQSLAGNDQNKFDLNGKEFNINIRLDQNDAKNIQDLKRITFRTQTGNRVFLDQFATLYIENVQGSLERKNRIPLFVVTSRELLPEQFLQPSKNI